MKMIDDVFTACWECGTVFDIEGEPPWQQLKSGRKRFQYNRDMFCPLCHQGRLFEDTLRAMENRFQLEKHERRCAAQSLEDWKYRAGALQRTLDEQQQQLDTPQGE